MSHRKAKHGYQGGRFKCQKCDENFSKKQDLSKHLAKVHGIEEPVEFRFVIGRSFKRQKKLPKNGTKSVLVSDTNEVDGSVDGADAMDVLVEIVVPVAESRNEPNDQIDEERGAVKSKISVKIETFIGCNMEQKANSSLTDFNDNLLSPSDSDINRNEVKTEKSDDIKTACATNEEEIGDTNQEMEIFATICVGDRCAECKSDT